MEVIHAADLWTRMTDSWGYFTGDGYGGHLFPVVIGETGTMYKTVSPSLLTQGGSTASCAAMPRYLAKAQVPQDGDDTQENRHQMHRYVEACSTIRGVKVIRSAINRPCIWHNCDILA